LFGILFDFADDVIYWSEFDALAETELIGLSATLLEALVSTQQGTGHSIALLVSLVSLWLLGDLIDRLGESRSEFSGLLSKSKMVELALATQITGGGLMGSFGSGGASTFVGVSNIVSAVGDVRV